MRTSWTRREFCRLAGVSGAACMLADTAGCSDMRVPQGSPGSAPAGLIARSAPQGEVPLIAVEGTAYECGYRYGEMVLERYPGYRRYLDAVGAWQSLPPEVRRLFERRAPYLLDVYRGLGDATQLPASRRAEKSSVMAASDACTSFGVSGTVTQDGQPISGQTKDTVLESALLYIVLRMRIKKGPTILVLAYPGEVLGYGLWSTGMSIFRNSLYCRGGDGRGLTMEQWGLLTLAGTSVEEASELALKQGISTIANCLISDATGRSVNVESNAGGVSVVPARDGIATHANHPVGGKTSAHEHFAYAVERHSSHFRAEHLWKLLDAERGRLTAAKAMMCLADHSRYPHGLCRHLMVGEPRFCTTAAVIAEPTRGLLHVTRGHPCANWPASYGI